MFLFERLQLKLSGPASADPFRPSEKESVDKRQLFKSFQTEGTQSRSPNDLHADHMDQFLNKSRLESTQIGSQRKTQSSTGLPSGQQQAMKRQLGKSLFGRR